MKEKGNYNFFRLFIILVFTLIIIYCITLLILKCFIFPRRYFNVVEKEASKNLIDPYLVLAIIKTESNFNKEANSKKDAKGLMQIMDATAKDMLINDERLHDFDIYDENLNIELGCKYLNTLILKYKGNYYLAICAYNAGMGNLDRWIKNGILDSELDEYRNVYMPYAETSKYLEKVISTYKFYRLLY